MTYDPTNNWQDRERYNETHDECGNLAGPLHPSTAPGPPPPGTLEYEALWRGYASRAMVDYANEHITFTEAVGRVMKAAVEMSRTRDTIPADIVLPESGSAISEAELHDDVRLSGGDYQYARE